MYDANYSKAQINTTKMGLKILIQKNEFAKKMCSDPFSLQDLNFPFFIRIPEKFSTDIGILAARYLSKTVNAFI